MDIEKSILEKRDSARFVPKEKLLVAFPLSDGRRFAGLGEILDISKGGLSLLCMTGKVVAPSNVSEVVILTYNNGYVPLAVIPCMVVYDTELIRGSSGSLLRRCGVKFQRELAISGNYKANALVQALFSSHSNKLRRHAGDLR